MTTEIVISQRTWPGDGGTERATVSAEIGDDGTVRVVQHDMGPSVVRTYGKEDVEHIVTLSQESAGLLLLRLLADRFGAADRPKQALLDLLAAHDIAHTSEVW